MTKKQGVKKKRQTGLPPGTIMYTGQKHLLSVRITYMEYNDEVLKQETHEHTTRIPIHESRPDIIQWYDVRGLHDEKLMQTISERFGMHPLVLEDIVDVYKRPEYTEYPSGLFMALKAFDYDEVRRKVKPQSMAIYWGQGFVLSFQEDESDYFKPVRDRLVAAQGRIRRKGGDYLAYALMDYVVDRYFHVLDHLETAIENMEEEIYTNPEDIDKSEVYTLKKQLLRLRKSIAPLREAVGQFTRTSSPLVDPETLVYVRDLFDHTYQVLDTIDTLRDVITGLQDLYLSEMSMKMNRIMQFLTVITAVFVPISFLAGLYGMNFQYMPELGYRNGYFVLLGVMLCIVLGMLFFFKKKRWL